MDKQKPHIKWVGLFAVLLLPTLVFMFLETGKNIYEKLEILYPIESEEKYHTIPEFNFLNQEGLEIQKKDVTGKVWIANFFFATCPSICPVMNNNLLRVQKEVQKKYSGTDFKILSFTVNPEHDTVAVLKKYANKLGVNTENWHFLTGKKEEIYSLAHKGMFLGAAADPTAEGGFLHSESVIIIDKEGRVRSGKDKNGNTRGAYNATSDVEIKDLIDDILYLLAEYELEFKKKEE